MVAIVSNRIMAAMASCEILSVGTELLLGQIVNTNSQFLAEELAGLGISCYFQTTVGDNKSRLISAIKLALSRADMVLITGGLGPTADDLTTECVAEAFHMPLIFDQTVMDRIEEFFRLRGVAMPQSNRKQALRPQGSEILPNPRGTAPGIIWEVPEQLVAQQISPATGARIIMTFPGVPGEMKAMWHETAVPYLRRKFGQQVLWSVDLKHYGIGESALAEKYAHLLDLSNPTVAPYAGHGECKLRVTAHAASTAEAQSLAAPIIAEIERDSGELCYGRDRDTLETVVARRLVERSLTLAVAESCTGGWLSKRLTDVAGSSAYTRLNLVTYANEMKQKFLGVSEETLAKHGAVSEHCAREMAQGMLRAAEADIAISITGIAGPSGGTQEKPVGLVFIGLADGNQTQVRVLQLPHHLAREEIRYRSCSEALNLVRLYLLRTG
jgi:nicotinamide-nucleotide amidase